MHLAFPRKKEKKRKLRDERKTDFARDHEGKGKTNFCYLRERKKEKRWLFCAKWEKK